MPEHNLSKIPSLRSLLKESTFHAYEGIAEEYDDESHQTCRDFDEMTRRFLISKLDMVLKAETILALGGGTGIMPTVLKEIVSLNGKHIHVVDPSNRMLEVYRQKHRDLPLTFERKTATNSKAAKPFDLVVATLCEPFLIIQFLDSLPSLVGINGSFTLSFPHEKWTKLVRKPKELMTTCFGDLQGRDHVARSICRDPAQLRANLQNLGLVEVDYQFHDHILDETQRSELTHRALERRRRSSVPAYARLSGGRKP